MSWLGRLGLRGPLWFASALAGVVLGLGLFTFWYARGASYFSSDPRSCVNCHIMNDQYDSWQKASHHAHATCVDCHLPHDFVDKYVAKAENGFWHSEAFTLENFHEPIRIGARNAHILKLNCIECHRALVADLIEHGAFADDSNNCIRCHVAVGHGAPK
jgi:cytochrome c nitrite reductase small subunit